MKKLLATVMLALAAITAQAQEEKTVQLQEVRVQAARIVATPDGQTIIPSLQQKEHSANGYDLLGKLRLHGIRVDEVQHSVQAIDNRGSVQLRINGAVASKQDLLSLNPKTIRTIHFKDNPGVRYGTGIEYVIDILTRRDNSGYTLGTDLTNTLTSYNGDNLVFAKLYRGKHEFALDYNFSYNDERGRRYTENADYLLSDGSHRLFKREDVARRNRAFGNGFNLKYTLADSTLYMFQATLSTSFDHTPDRYSLRKITDNGHVQLSEAYTHEHSTAPSLDLYFFHQLGKHQSLTANAVGTTIATRTGQSNDEGSLYAYRVEGRTWSVMSEAVYENVLRPFTFSAGLHYSQKYTRNRYLGDVNDLVRMHSNSLYLFAEVRGQLKKLRYVAGMGVAYEHYRQGSYHYNYRLPRPKLTLNYAISSPLSLRYSIEYSQYVSKVAMVSDTRIRTNSMEWTVGSPYIRPNSELEQTVALTYNKPRLSAGVIAYYRYCRHPNMAVYERTAGNQFLSYQKNQRNIQLAVLNPYARYDVIPDKLILSMDGSLCHFINHGDEYNHHYTSFNHSFSAQAFLGRWTLTGVTYSGWDFMEGEVKHKDDLQTALTCSYRLGNCLLGIRWSQPFQAHPRQFGYELMNRFIHKNSTVFDKDKGNRLTFTLSWKLEKGKKSTTHKRRLQNKDTQTGIL